MRSLISFTIFTTFLFSVFFMNMQSLYAGPDVTYKEARPRMGMEEVQKQSEYFYNPKDKPDPFAPFVINQEVALQQLQQGATVSDQLMQMLSQLEDLKKPRTELQRIDLADLILTSIVSGNGKATAMVQGPNGMGYILKKGTLIGKNGGKVDQIVSEETKTDLGNQFIRKVVIKEPYPDIKEGQIKYKEIEMSMSASAFN
jgi:type IV pilus assembly protein PilP